MKVLVFNGCWTPNIGNAFVNLGMEQLVKQAFPDCDVIYSADIANKWFFEVSSGSLEKSENSFCISEYLDVDLAVWGGMMLTKPIQLAMKAFLALSERGIPLLFLGAGADKYTKEEADYVADCLKQLKYAAVITRDDATYELYSQYDFLKWRIAKGVDAAFFTADMDIPGLHIRDYDVECFDRILAPHIEHNGKQVIYTHHDCYGKMPARYTNQNNTLVSELPYDYLTLYKNADTVYAERVHACIVSFAFGNKARLYADTQRAALFDRVLEHGAERVRKEAVSVDKEKLAHEKCRMVQNTKTFYHAFEQLKFAVGGGRDECSLLQVYIETVSSCNRKCPYCYYAPGNDASKNGRKMTEETFEKIIDNLAKYHYANLLYLYDINEPLLDNRMPHFIRKAAERLPNSQIYIFSNGDLAEEELVKEYFDQGLTHFVFSIHDHKNDEKIKRIISKMGKDRFTIADMTILKTEEFVNRGGSIQSAQIASQKRYMHNSCWLPFRQVLINPDGDFRLCCSIRDEVLLGNIWDMDIMDYFYHSNELNAYRKHLQSGDRRGLFPCQDCSFAGDNEEGIKYKLGQDYELRQAIYAVNGEGII